MVIKGTKTSWATLTLVVVVGGLLLILFLRARWSKPPNLVDAAFERTRATMRDLNMVPLREREDIEQALQAMAIERADTNSVNEQQIAALRQTMTDLITLYYLRETSEDYKAYRCRTGATLVSREDLEQSLWPLSDSIGYINDMYAGKGVSIDPDASVEELYDAFWNARKRVAGAQQPTAISAGSPGVAVTFRRMARIGMIQEGFGSDLGADAWFGGSTMGGRTWFRSTQPAADSDGLLVAQCGVVFEFDDGMRRPLLFLIWWDEQGDRWRLENVLMTNRPARHFAWPWEL